MSCLKTISGLAEGIRTQLKSSLGRAKKVPGACRLLARPHLKRPGVANRRFEVVLGPPAELSLNLLGIGNQLRGVAGTWG